MPLPLWVTTIFEPITKLIDDFHFSGEEKAAAKIAIINAQTEAATKVAEYELKLIDSQQKIIVAEAQGESWLQRNWRPITMLVFVFVIAWNYVISPIFSWASGAKFPILEIPEGMWSLLQVGIGGYVMSRSVEKIAGTIADSENISINLGSSKKKKEEG